MSAANTGRVPAPTLDLSGPVPLMAARMQPPWGDASLLSQSRDRDSLDLPVYTNCFLDRILPALSCDYEMLALVSSSEMEDNNACRLWGGGQDGKADSAVQRLYGHQATLSLSLQWPCHGECLRHSQTFFPLMQTLFSSFSRRLFLSF